MQSRDIPWREYNVHDDHGSTGNPTQEDEEGWCQPVDIFAPKEEEVYELREYKFHHGGDDGEGDSDGGNTGKEMTITLRERSDYDVSTGMSVWQGAEILCQYLTARPAARTAVRGRRVLELGAGTGLCGLVAAGVLGAAIVRLTDGDGAVLRNLRGNVARNGLGDRASCPQLIWGAARAAEFAREHGRHDVVLATDCVYVTKSVRPLFETVARLLTPKDGVFLFVNSCASTCPLEEVMRIGKEFGFTVSSACYQPISEKDPVFVFRR